MNHLAKNTLKAALILAMLLSTICLTAITGNNNLFAAEAEGNVHVLEANTLNPFAQGEKADGDTEVVNDYFTVIYSAKSKNDSSTKTWADEYTSSQRINFGGKAETEKNSVKFTTSGPATVKIWWASGGDRQMVILDGAGNEVAKTTDPSVKNDPYLSKLELSEAGTYFLGGDTGSNYIFKIEVEEIPAGNKLSVLEANTLNAFAQGEKADGDTEIVNNYFTVIYSAKSKNDSSTKTWADEYTSSQRINFGGKAETTKNSVKFTTNNPATVKIWWASGGDRQMVILDGAGNEVAKTTDPSVKNEPYLSTLELPNAGTYFLGGDTGSNYIFKIEVEEIAVTEKVSTLEANTLAAFAAGEKADGESESVADYFTVIYSAKSKNDSSTKTWADDYTSSQRINFGGKAETGKNSIKFTTTGPATVKVWWASGGDRQMVILDSEGNEVVKTADPSVKNDPYLSTLELANAGTYFLGGDTGNNYIFKVQVTETVGQKPARADWASVAAPAILNVATALDENGQLTDQITVTVSGEVGYDAADQITVTMRDQDGWELKSLSSLAERSEHELTFAPGKTGDYSFEVKATRDGETTAHNGAETQTFAFTYPLGTPVMKYAVNDGKGGLTVEWNPVKEATDYIVTVKESIENKVTITKTVKGVTTTLSEPTITNTKTVTTNGNNSTRADVADLTMGSTAEVTVTALRTTDTTTETGTPCEAVEVTVSPDAEIAWVFSAFGQSTDTVSDGFEKIGDSVRVFSLNGKGKVQPAEQDGLAFYYTALDPNTTNFVLSATANVNSWTYSNGQEGFGLLVMDQIGVHGTNDPVYCNSFMIAGSGLSSVSTMRLGIGALARTGVPEYSATKPANYKGTWLANMSGVDSSINNIVGNCTNLDKLAERGPNLDPALTTFKFILEKNDDGYFVTYIDHNGIAHTEQYPEALSTVDPYIYVGMFAARNMDVTFTDIQFTTTETTATAPVVSAEEEVTADFSADLRNPTMSNQSAFALDIRVNADSQAIVTDATGTEVYNGPVKAGTRNLVPVTLADGANQFSVVVTPDAESLTTDGLKLASYTAKTISTTVNYSVDSRSVIYVSPTGTAEATGTADDPTTLQVAVKNPAPGTVIYIKEGTYELTSGITIQRGINGTSENPITLTADPEATTRPVLDSQGKGNGLTLSADYWHLYGFDSTGSTAKGVHVGGNHNIIERVCTYRNLNTGFSVTRTWSSDDMIDWPSYNLVLNCSSWLNADSGYEDADGFEAKLTNGVGNVFDGCIAAYNADDGWDLYARGVCNGVVTLQNCVTFKNGYDIVDGKEVNAGNGNGFKLGGNNYPVDHIIINSIAFANKASGITCNSNPNLKVENCTTFDNGTGISLYTTIASLDTAFDVHGLISYGNGSSDSIKVQGNQSKDAYLNSTNYYQGNVSGTHVADDWFVNLDTNAAIANLTRAEDGSISLGGYLDLTSVVPQDSGARLGASEHTLSPETIHLIDNLVSEN